MDVIESAFSDGADANTKLEAELASDRNAAVSVIYPEQAKIGRMLSTPEGAPSPLFRGLQLLVVATAVGLIAIAPDALAGTPVSFTACAPNRYLFPPRRFSIFVKLGDEGSQSFCSAERREASAQECKMRGSILPIMG